MGNKLLSLLSRALIAALVLVGSCGGGGGASSPGDQASVSLAASQAVNRLNMYRATAGVSPVELDLAISLGAQNHANWLVANNVQLSVVGLDAHNESPGTPGFTFEGRDAGRNSVIYQGVGAVEAIDNWFRTFYHRLGMLDPNLKYVGFGLAGDFVVLDIHSGKLTGALASPGAVVYPCPGQAGVPAEYKREIPHPIEGDDSIGIPITVEFFGQVGFFISGVEASLLDIDSMTPVDFYIQVPGEPFLDAWDLGQVVCLIPKDPLKRGAHYQVALSGSVDGSNYSYTWVFTTR